MKKQLYIKNTRILLKKAGSLKRSLRYIAVAYPGILFGGGVQQIQLRTEDRENRDLGAAAP